MLATCLYRWSQGLSILHDAGPRSLTIPLLLYESVWGLCLVAPVCLVAAQIALRLRSTLLLAIITDALLGLWWSSVSCVPLYGGYADSCEPYLRFTPEALALLLTVRLSFVCLAVWLGESLFFVAITGGIACGKSTVVQLLLDRPQQSSKNTSSSSWTSWLSDDEDGAFGIVDADAIAHQVLLPPRLLVGTSSVVKPQESVYDAVVETFGTSILTTSSSDHNSNTTATIDRTALGAVVFADPKERKKLNRLTHPRILSILLKRLVGSVFSFRYDVVGADVPLLYESSLHHLFGLIVVVASDHALERLQRRNPELTLQQCQERIASQMDIRKKVQRAHIVVWNNGTEQELAKRVQQVRLEIMGHVYSMGLSMLHTLLLVGWSAVLAQLLLQ